MIVLCAGRPDGVSIFLGAVRDTDYAMREFGFVDADGI